MGEHSLWKSREEWEASAQGRPGLRGTGFALGGWLGGLQPTGATVRLNPDGSLNVLTGQVDIAGTNIALAQIAASAFGVDFDQVKITTGDTDSAPLTGLCAGSKTIYTVGTAVLQAAQDARRQTLEIAAKEMEASIHDLEIQDGSVVVRGVPDKGVTLASIGKKGNLYMSKVPPVLGMAIRPSPCRRPAFAAQLARIEVDPDTGELTLHDFVAVQDAGKAINPLGVEGQMQGGAVQSLGIAHHRGDHVRRERAADEREPARLPQADRGRPSEHRDDHRGGAGAGRPVRRPRRRRAADRPGAGGHRQRHRGRHGRAAHGAPLTPERIALALDARATGASPRPPGGRAPIRPKLKVWVTFGEGLKFGDGRAQLLELIEQRGSLRRAACELAMSYRNAWGYLRDLEEAAGFTSWSACPGVARGGMRLTARQALPAALRQVRRGLEDISKRHFERTFARGDSMNAGEIFVAGTWRAPLSGETYQPINPANEEPLAPVGKGDERDIDLAVAAARRAFDEGPWPRMGAHERGRLVWRLGELIQQHLDEMAKLESVCTGKTMFDSGKVEIPFAAEVFRYFGGWASKIHGETLALRDNAFTFTLRQPVGVVGAIVPWNSPSCSRRGRSRRRWPPATPWCSSPRRRRRSPRSGSPSCARRRGCPRASSTSSPGPAARSGMAIVRDPRVDKIAFTGSTEVGKQIMREAAGTLKRLSLELGGKSPNIVFADADMEAAVRGAMTGIFYNKGEVCAAGSRLFLEEPIHDEFMAKLTDRVKTLKVGDPMDKATRMGPVVSKAQMETVLSYIEAGKQEGARVVAGGGRAGVGRRQGLLHRAHDLRRRDQRHEDRPGRDLRPRPLGDPVQVGGGGDRPGQRHALRARRRGVDARRDQGAQGCPGHPGRHGVGERLQPLRRRPAVRRLQGVGFRARDGLGRPRPLHRGRRRSGSTCRSARLGGQLRVVYERRQSCWDGTRIARLNLLEEFSHAITAVSSTSASSE